MAPVLLPCSLEASALPTPPVLATFFSTLSMLHVSKLLKLVLLIGANAALGADRECRRGLLAAFMGSPEVSATWPLPGMRRPVDPEK